MKLEIKSKSENKLLERTEIQFIVNHEKCPTPSRQEVCDQIVAQLGAESNTIAIPSLISSFGEEISKGVAHIYKSEQNLKSTEPKYVLKRHESKKKAEAAPEEAKPVEVKAEKPAEEKKEVKAEE